MRIHVRACFNMPIIGTFYVFTDNFYPTKMGSYNKTVTYTCNVDEKFVTHAIKIFAKRTLNGKQWKEQDVITISKLYWKLH